MNRQKWVSLLGAVLIAAASSSFAGSGLVTGSGAEPKEKQAPGQPDYSYKGLDGEMHSLTEWNGKVVMLNFWASWCSPCLNEIKEFVHYQEQYGKRGLQIIGLGLDEARKLKNVARTLGINYPVLVAEPGSNRKLLAKWGNSSGLIPYTVFFDKSGKLSGSHKGVIDDQTFEQKILPLLDDPG